VALHTKKGSCLHLKKYYAHQLNKKEKNHITQKNKQEVLTIAWVPVYVFSGSEISLPTSATLTEDRRVKGEMMLVSQQRGHLSRRE
jgi:hypothetical protein